MTLLSYIVNKIVIIIVIVVDSRNCILYNAFKSPISIAINEIDSDNDDDAISNEQWY